MRHISIFEIRMWFFTVKNMLIGQSGGPTAAINASLAGAIQEAMASAGIGEIYGTCNGLEGVLKRHILNLRIRLKTEDDFQLLKSTPGMALGSCRFKLPGYPDDTYGKIADIFRRYDIGYFFYIGGNDSMDTVDKLSAYFASRNMDIRAVGIPKTIDNDLPGTDHTPGFASAAKFVATSMAEIACDSRVYDMPSFTVVEIMGRNAGWLTAASVLAREGGHTAPHLILLPEVVFDPDAFLARIRDLQTAEKNIVVAVSEGIRLANGKYVAENGKGGPVDAFGHAHLSGSGAYLGYLLRSNFPCKVRTIELSVLQRSAAHLCSDVDILEAEAIGKSAVRLALEGRSGVMAIIRRMSNDPYHVEYGSVPVCQVANQERKVPLEWIDPAGFDVTEAMMGYLRPLVLGENSCCFRNGIPRHFSFDKKYVRL